MKALAVFPRRRRLELIETEPPAIEASEDVLVRVLEVGVCGTDHEITEFAYGTPPPGEDHLVIGHESLAEVVETGPEVSGLAPGDLVVPMVRRPCPRPDCPACRSGRQDFCYTGEFTERGIRGRHGFLTELVVDRARFFTPVPHELRDVGVLVEPLTIAEKALRQVWNIQARLPWGPEVAGEQRYRALVLGAGPVGLLGAMVLADAGFETCVYSREAASGRKAGVARAIGARYVSASEVAADELQDATGNIDLVYEATGASRLAFEVIRLLSPNAIFIFTGVPGRKAPVEIDTDRLMRDLVLKNQVVFGTVNAGPGSYRDAVRDLRAFRERWSDAVAALITGRFALEDHARVFDGSAGGIKNVFVVSRGT